MIEMRKDWLRLVVGHEFQFTRKWFANRNLNTFREHVLPEWSGKPILYLEIGVFEGMSLTWMLQKVLTHPNARAVGIDPWLMTSKLNTDQMEAVMARAFHNTEPWREKCQLVRANSVEVLRRILMRRKPFAGIKRGTVDLCMIDGSHDQLGVLSDARQCFRLLKVGGCMLFDDVENSKPKVDHVREGLDMFLREQPAVELAWRDGFVECYRKRRSEVETSREIAG